MGTTLITIQQGVPVVSDAAITFLGIGSAGDPSACRILTFPTTVTQFLPPLVYSSFSRCWNPSRTFGVDNDILTGPLTTPVLTLGSTRVVRFETGIGDQIVTELWQGSDRQGSMVTALFRQFYDYLVNSATLDGAAGELITWEPRDRNAFTYAVELLRLTVGTGAAAKLWDLQDFRDRGGQAGGGELDNALDAANTLPTGYIDRPVELVFRVVGKVV